MVACESSSSWNGTDLCFSFVGETLGVTSLEGEVRRGSLDGESLSRTSREGGVFFFVGELLSWPSILLGGSLQASASSCAGAVTFLQKMFTPSRLLHRMLLQ